ncbi:hypothetical protein D9M68_859220 [compost metagenome]
MDVAAEDEDAARRRERQDRGVLGRAVHPGLAVAGFEGEAAGDQVHGLLVRVFDGLLQLVHLLLAEHGVLAALGLVAAAVGEVQHHRTIRIADIAQHEGPVAGFGNARGPGIAGLGKGLRIV